MQSHPTLTLKKGLFMLQFCIDDAVHILHKTNMFPKSYRTKMGYDYLEPGTRVTYNIDAKLSRAHIHYGEIVRYDEMTGYGRQETKEEIRIKKCRVYKMCNNIKCCKKAIKMKYCVGCKKGSMGKRFYCSRKCQKIHWFSEHKEYCAIYA